jgi:hypothetical protein
MRRCDPTLCIALLALSGQCCIQADEKREAATQTAQPQSAAADADRNIAGLRWLKWGFEIRGRGEGNTGIYFVPGNNDAYYLHRLRLNLAVEASKWLRLFLQVEGSEAPGYSRNPVPGTVVDPLDFHQSYVEFGSTGEGPWGFRVGRQELFFGDGRLIGNSNWGNVGRTFDAARLTLKRSKTRLDFFASSVVVPKNGGFDLPHFNNKFHGFYSSFESPFRFTEVVEVYALLKTFSRASGELGFTGNLRVYTYGTRASGALPHGIDYGLETAVQTGHISQNRVRAWGGHWQLGYRPPCLNRSWRLAVGYTFASGDGNPRDGRASTFDQLYPSNHDKLGTLDRIGWRNIRDFAAKMEWKASRRWTLNLEYHDFWLSSRQDALYAENGLPYVYSPNATSNRVGQELDSYVVFLYSKRINLGAGYAHMFPGPYLIQTRGPYGASYPYLMWRYKL